MKLSTYSPQIGLSYKTDRRSWKAGKRHAYRLTMGIIVDPMFEVISNVENVIFRNLADVGKDFLGSVGMSL